MANLGSTYLCTSYLILSDTQINQDSTVLEGIRVVATCSQAQPPNAGPSNQSQLRLSFLRFSSVVRVSSVHLFP